MKIALMILGAGNAFFAIHYALAGEWRSAFVYLFVTILLGAILAFVQDRERRRIDP